MIRMGKKLRRKAKAEEADPFAPEAGTDSWFKTQQAVTGGKVGDIPLLLWMASSWPNLALFQAHVVLPWASSSSAAS